MIVVEPCLKAEEWPIKKKQIFFFLLFASPLAYYLFIGINDLRAVSKSAQLQREGQLVGVGTSAYRSLASAGPCTKWNSAQHVGSINRRILPEASGLAVSLIHPNRLYHINDSDSGTRFYISDLQGGHLENNFVDGHRSQDLEDISVGPCPYGRSCLFLADIGDNHLDRTQVKITVIKEEMSFPEKITPMKVLKISYPQKRARNAEAFAIHPLTGDLYLITKQISNEDKKEKRKVLPPVEIFRLSRSTWTSSTSEDKLQWEQVGGIDMYTLVGSDKVRTQAVTGMAIAPHGKSFTLLTYGQAMEIHRDLSTENAESLNELTKAEVVALPIEKLDQQEGISYLILRDGRQALIYDSESDHSEDSPLVMLSCSQ